MAMTAFLTRLRRGRASGTGGWSALAVVFAALIVAPIAAVVWLAAHPTENIWPHLLATTLPRYLENSAVLAAGVGALTACVGAGAAWIVAMYRFPGHRWLEWALLFPLAIPAYVTAYALVDFLDYSGPLQGLLRDMFGWQSAQDYWFPQVRSRWAAVVVLAASFYPYAYLMARNAFREQSGASYEVARALGAGPLALFWRVGLPLARPAIVAGAAIAMMETVADFGVVDYFGVQTLTTGIFTTWLEAGNAGGAAQIALVILGVVFALFAIEALGRRRSRYYQSARQSRPVTPIHLKGWAGGLAFALCFVPFAIGFVLPVAVIGAHALANPEGWIGAGLLLAAWHSLLTGGVASLVCVAMALVMVYGMRLSGQGLPRLVIPLTALGYAAPGAVLAVGILIPLAAFDNWQADTIWALTGHDPGLVLTGTGVAIILAYVVRFFAVAQASTDAAFGRVPPSLPMAARSLGRGLGQILREVYLPLMRGSVGSALLLVFVECVKELPATLLLRPFNYETLATRVHEKASLENLGDAAPAALLVMAVGLAAVVVLARANLSRR
ncbi:iron ABC transporter permease [Thioclava sp. 'Guangxiensis']|uniref:ABC transporter permease n=1 Tax=Thioclava sp. 'Guangxiensis' TaxID=3149044 RepID=UPI003877E215